MKECVLMEEKKKEFKVGDRVRVHSLDSIDTGRFVIGQILTIKRIGAVKELGRYSVVLEGKEDFFLWNYQLESVETPQASDSKPTNPKDAIGSTKLPLNLVPDSLTAYAALSFAEGASKYGSYNWRVAGVRASIYKAALERHLKKWWNGEECDPKTKVPHLASVIACAAIILDADLAGKLTDDRPPKVPMGQLIDGMEGIVKGLYEMHKDMKPHHHTALDAQGGA
jgi:hypothetical protein